MYGPQYVCTFVRVPASPKAGLALGKFTYGVLFPYYPARVGVP